MLARPRMYNTPRALVSGSYSRLSFSCSSRLLALLQKSCIKLLKQRHNAATARL
jgi:hypothetical protein